jgi:hypothetical protein
MSARTWDQVLAEQQHRARVLSPERVRAELEWARITGKSSAIFGDPLGYVPCIPIRPEPVAPRGRGKRQHKATRPVLVERKSTRLLTTPDGQRVACKRTSRTYIAAA